MKATDFILKLYSLPQTIFTLKELSLLFPDARYENLKSQVNYFVKKGKLIGLRRGINAKEGYNPRELANKIFTPSYISFETVLSEKGIIFQAYETIFVASYLSRKIIVGKDQITYRKIEDQILFNLEGVEKKDNYFIASAERAFLDTVYLYKDYHFDNLSPLNWDKVMEFKKIYHNKALEKRAIDYVQH